MLLILRTLQKAILKPTGNHLLQVFVLSIDPRPKATNHLAWKTDNLSNQLILIIKFFWPKFLLKKYYLENYQNELRYLQFTVDYSLYNK